MQTQDIDSRRYGERRAAAMRRTTADGGNRRRQFVCERAEARRGECKQASASTRISRHTHFPEPSRGATNNTKNKIVTFCQQPRRKLHQFAY